MKLAKPTNKRVVGSVRQSQLITTFGVGSMVDFVSHTAMTSGTDAWTWATDESQRIHNINLQHLLGVKYFVKPKVSVKEHISDKDSPDVPATIFPLWMYCPSCKRLMPASEKRLSKGKFVCTCGEKKYLVPSRFVLVCPEGHIEDFPYSWWVHEAQGNTKDPQKNHDLKMYYVGNRTDMDSLFIECSCGAKRTMKGASSKNAFAGFGCSGNRPWLGDHEKCHAGESGEHPQMRIRNESSVYFSATVSALSIPPWGTKISKYMFQKLQDIARVMNLNDENNREILIELIVRQTHEKFPLISKSDICDHLNKLLKNENSAEEITLPRIMEDEYMALSTPYSDEHNSDYLSHEEAVPDEYAHIIDNIISCDRLTVVTAMVGFKRLTAPTSYNDPGLCKISKTKKEWYPGIEMRGEGIFIIFNQELLRKWCNHYGSRYDAMQSKLEASYFHNEMFSPQYVFLHSFAHLFIRELSNVCGYSSASLKERVYSSYSNSDKQMAGILIYTSTADSDGSLGGLTEQAKKVNMKRILNSMVERGKWCSSDPICYTSKDQGAMALNYAACFACTLLPETSCEFHNALLDRCAVCGRPDDEKIGVMNWKASE